MRSLTGSQVSQLHDALLDAYPSRTSLALMVRLGLEESLEQITGGENQGEVVFNLINWAESSGRIDELLIAAYRENPRNLRLNNVYKEFIVGTSVSKSSTDVDSPSTTSSLEREIIGRDTSTWKPPRRRVLLDRIREFIRAIGSVPSRWSSRRGAVPLDTEHSRIEFPQSLIDALNQPSWIPAKLESSDLVDTGIYRRLDSIIRDVKVATESDNIQDRQLILRQALVKLEQLGTSVDKIDSPEARIWKDTIVEWQKVIASEVRRFHSRLDEIAINPYQTGNPLHLEQQVLFKGRRDLRDKVVRALLEGSRPTVVLHGPRRMGKTSFLLQLPALLPGNTIPVYMDLQRPAFIGSASAFLFYLASSIQKATLPYGIEVSAPERSRFDNDAFEMFAHWLEEEVEPKLHDLDSYLLLAFDEFERLGLSISLGKIPFEILDELRHLIQHHERIAFLFAGVQTLDALSPNWSSYFVNVKALPIGYLEDADARELITSPNPTSRFNLIYENRVIESIMNETRCQPLLLQLLCSCCVDIANSRGVNLIDMKILDTAIADALIQGETLYFRNVWDEMAGPDGQPILMELMAGQFEYSDQLAGTLNRLVQLRVLRKCHDSYEIELPLVKRWLSKHLDS